MCPRALLSESRKWPSPERLALILSDVFFRDLPIPADDERSVLRLAMDGDLPKVALLVLADVAVGMHYPVWFLAVCRLRSEEHTSELQSLRHLVCRLLLEKK